MTKTILVTGVTGQQGGAVALALLAAGDAWRVVGLSRNPGSARAAALHALGIDIRQGDMTDRGSLAKVMRKVDGVFSVQGNAKEGAEVEVRQGCLVAEAAAVLLANQLARFM